MTTNETGSPPASNPTGPVEARKKGFWNGFFHFLAMGGFLVILIVVFALIVGISVAMNSCGK